VRFFLSVAIRRTESLDFLIVSVMKVQRTFSKTIFSIGDL